METNNTAAALGQSDIDSLSPIYFETLSRCSDQEADRLLTAPDFSDSEFASRVTPTQAHDYLNAIVSLSPTALSSSASTLPSALSAAARSLPFSESVAAASSASPTKTGSVSSTSIKLFVNIRNAAGILASSPTTRHQISTCGIIPKLNIRNNPYAHVEFLQCCILASQYRYAQRHFHKYTNLDDGSESASANNTGVSNFQIVSGESSSKKTELFLRYHYLRGVIFFASNDVQSAISEWNHCISAPSMTVSQITVDAWKKMVLAKCQLFQYDDEEEMVHGNGKKFSGASAGDGMKGAGTKGAGTPCATVYKLVKFVTTLPKGTSHVVSRFFNVSSGGVSSGGMLSHSQSREAEGSNARDSLIRYHEVLNMFFKNDLQILNLLDASSGRAEASTETNAERSATPNLFEEDCNVGMIKQLVPIMRWRKLRSIAKIYSAIPLAKLAAKLSLSAEDCVQFLLQVALRQEKDGASKFRATIDFTVDDERGVIYFDEESESGELHLEGNIEKCMALAKRVKDLDVAMASSAKFQVNALKSVGEKDAKGENNDSRSVIEIA